MQIVDTFQNRLKKSMDIRNFKQVDLAKKTGLDKTLINKYLAGLMKAKQDKLTILADVLNVNEVWLMGYDVPMDKDFKEQDGNANFRYAEYNGLNTEGLTEEDIEEIKAYIEMRRNINKNKNKQ